MDQPGHESGNQTDHDRPAPLARAASADVARPGLLRSLKVLSRFNAAIGEDKAGQPFILHLLQKGSWAVQFKLIFSAGSCLLASVSEGETISPNRQCKAIPLAGPFGGCDWKWVRSCRLKPAFRPQWNAGFSRQPRSAHPHLIIPPFGWPGLVSCFLPRLRVRAGLQRSRRGRCGCFALYPWRAAEQRPQLAATVASKTAVITRPLILNCT